MTSSSVGRAKREATAFGRHSVSATLDMHIYTEKTIAVYTDSFQVVMIGVINTR